MLEELSAALDRLVEIEPVALADGDTVVEPHRQLERLTAVTTRAVAAFESAGEFEEEGARSAASYLAYLCRLPAATARARVRLGRALRHLPVAEAAWLGGELGEAQVGLLARACTRATAEPMARDEELLVGQAKALRFSTFAKVTAYWRLRADPEGTEGDAAAAREGRRFHFSQSFEGN